MSLETAPFRPDDGSDAFDSCKKTNAECSGARCRDKVFFMISFEDLTAGRGKLAVVGLGYVGLPLAVALAERMDVAGFDVNRKRVEELRAGRDHTREVAEDRLRAARIEYSADPSVLGKAQVIIVAVPTPIDAHRSPDLGPVVSATELVGRNMAPGTVVVYESTVYPGLTEEICVPLLERESGLSLGRDFSVGYSPERINPGDKVHTLSSITKVVSGSDPATLDLLASIYGSVVSAGVHRASSIRVAEAAKVIENTQRDLNIALMNELAIIFDKMGIDTLEVLEAAGSKWNFLPFRPGLVGGHCIGVDPYYLTFKAEELGFHPQVILAGRRVNDDMGKYVAEWVIKNMIRKGRQVSGARIGILGFTFKENVPDLRNTRVVDVIRELEDYGANVLVHDAEADADEALAEYGQKLVPLSGLGDLDALVIAVGHKAYGRLGPAEIAAFFARPEEAMVFDVKGFFDPEAMRGAGLDYRRL